MTHPARLAALEAVASAARVIIAQHDSREWSAVASFDAWQELRASYFALDALPPTPEPAGEVRKAIQIAMGFDAGDGVGCSSYQPAMVTTALCDDGTIWERVRHGEWVRLPTIPATVTLPIARVAGGEG